MGGSPPHFEGKNFAYWKVRMTAYLDAIAPEVSLVSNTTGHNGPFQIVLLYDSLSPISTRSSVRAVQIGLVPAWAGGISMSGQQD